MSISKTVAYHDVEGNLHATAEEAVASNLAMYIRSVSIPETYCHHGSVQIARFLVEKRHAVTDILGDLK